MAPPAHASKQQPSATSRAWDALTPALSEWILEAVSHMGFDRMTPVQASTIPLFTGNKDVVVEAVTGSGKTLSFLIPVIEKLLHLDEPIKKHHIGAIIISPTRELATQIHSVLLSLLAFHPPSASCFAAPDPLDDSIEPMQPQFPSSTLKVVPQLLLGGTTTTSQDLAYFLNNSPNLLISTPGRLLELLSSPHVHCPQSSFEVLVLDEADRLLDLGFKIDLQKILQRLPKQRRTGLFSASVSEAVDQLVRVGLRNPVRIAVKVRGRDGKEEQRTPASLQMTYLTTPPQAKLPTLLSLLQHLTPQPQKSIAYVSTCAAVDYLSSILPPLLNITKSPSASPTSIQIIALHGKQSSTHRNRQFTAFITSTSPTLLLTTDVAARGLDIPSVDLTVQLDPPSDPKTFLHRAGRAGRAGRKGLAIVFLLPGRESEGYPSFLSVRKTPVTPLNESSIPDIDAIIGRGNDTDVLDRSLRKMREVALKDRALHDKAQRGFVSWVRSYSKHAASSIFRVSDLRWRDEAEAWGLLRLPRMPELKARSQGTKLEDGEAAASEEEVDRSLGLTVDWNGYRYKDAQQERKRQAEMKAAAEAKAAGVSSVGRERKGKASWSSKLDQQATAVARREKKAKRRAKDAWEKMTDEEKRQAREVEEMVGKVREKIVAS